MPVAKIQLPDGRIARFEVPEGTTPEQVMEFASQQDFSQAAPAPAAQVQAEVAPQQPQLPSGTFASPARPGGLEAALTIASAIPAEIAGGVAGLATALIPGTAPGSGAAVSESVREAFTFNPRTEEGKQALQDIGGSKLVKTIGDALVSAETKLGDAGFDLAGPIGGTIGTVLPTAILEAMGLGAPAIAARTAKTLAKGAVEAGGAAKAVFQFQSPTKQRIAQLIEKGEADISTAKFELIPTAKKAEPTGKIAKALNVGGPRVTKDRLAIDAIKQGFDEGVIAAVKGSSSSDKIAFRRMVNIMEKGKRNARFAVLNRPSDVVGDLLMGRVKVVKRANEAAGKKLDGVAKSLKGKLVQFEPAIDTFISDLGDMGITLTREKGKTKVDFSGSDIEGLAGPESVINRMVKRLSGTQAPDAFELHRMKRFIDEQVSFGKNAEGLAGKTEGILKKLRTNLDQTLDSNFPQYDKVNTQYSETIGALDAFQEVAGRKMDLTGPNAEKATGTLMRRLMGNAQSRITILDSVNEIESVAKKFGGKLDDQLKLTGPVDKSIQNDLIGQILFVDELESVFGPTARTSLEGKREQAVKRAATAASQQGVAGVALDIGAKTLEKARGINQEGAFSAIKKLLRK